MPGKLTIRILSAGLALLFSGPLLFPQETESNKPLSVDRLCDTLKQKYNIRFFYKSEWFENRTFDPSILELSFTELLHQIEAVSGISLITSDSVSYVFIPVKPVIKLPEVQKESGLITVGDINDHRKHSRATLSGKITNGINGSPMNGAYIIIEKLKLGTYSDEKGNYRLQTPAGDYTLRVSFLGYEEKIVKIKLISSGSLDFKLYEEAVKLPVVNIPSDRAESNVSGLYMSVVRLSLNDIRELPVSLSGIDVIKSITLRPGIQAVGEFGTGFNVRGGGADQNLILMEGVPLLNSSHLFGLISAVNSESISDITLLKAGIPANYGERASSVMDIHMGNREVARTRFKGEVGLINSSLNLETPLLRKKITLLLGARSSYSNWLLHSIPDIDLMNSSAHFIDANALLTCNLNLRNKISIFGYLSYDRFAHAGSDKVGFGINTDYQYMNLLGSVRWKHHFNDNLFFDLVAGISNYRFRVSESDTSRLWEAYRINSSILYRNLRWNFSWNPGGNHRFDFGLNSIIYNITPGSLTGLYNESVIKPVQMQSEKANESSAYLTDKINVNSRLSLELGLRYTLYSFLGPNRIYIYRANMSRTPESIIDSASYGKNQPICWYSGLEPRFSMRYNISADKSLKLSFNRIHQYVNLISNTAVTAPTDVWKLSSPDLRPLTCDQVAVGYFWNLKGDAFETSAEVYFKKLTNSIDYKNGSQILLNPYLEADLVNLSGKNYGIELNVKKNTGKLTGWIGFTYSRSLEKTSGRFPEDRINNNHSFPSDYDRPVSLVLNSNYNGSGRWRFGCTFNYSTGRPVTLPELKFDHQGYQVVYYSDRNKYRLPDYHRLDLSITHDESLQVRKKFKGSWTFSIINVYGRRNAYSVFYKKEQDKIPGGESHYGTYMLYIIGRPFPTLTYNISF